MILGVITHEDLVYFGGALFLVLAALLASSYFSWWAGRQKASPSPYTGKPLRSGADLHWMTVEKVLRFLFDKHDYHNQMFDLQRAAVCRETGRLFPDALTWYGSLKVDWSFIQKRYSGSFVSWGSLTEDQKLAIRDRHASLDGYQADYSSSNPVPRKIEKEYAYAKPGPLYVDIQTGVLLGWKSIPDTELEVMIVQKPLEKYLPGLGNVQK